MAASPVLVPGLVTIGIPTYNRPLLAERAARSVLAQTYPDIELLVSDDFCPEDDSEDRIAGLTPLVGGKQLRIIRQPSRLGLARNFDACLQNARGEFFLLLGDDDVLLPGAIEALVAGFLHPPEPLSPQQVGLSWCPCEIIDAGGAPLWKTKPGPAAESPADLLVNLWHGKRGPRLSSILVRTADARVVGGFQSRYGDLCDIGNWAQVALAYPFVFCWQQPLAQYANHQNSTTSQSSLSDWQSFAYVVHDDLLARARACGNQSAEIKVRKARSAFLSGITLTILMQTIGKPGWIANALRETVRKPGIMLGPLMLRRFLMDGWKLLRLK